MTTEEHEYKERHRRSQLESAHRFLAERGSAMSPEDFLKQLDVGIARTTHNEEWWFNVHNRPVRG